MVRDSSFWQDNTDISGFHVSKAGKHAVSIEPSKASVFLEGRVKGLAMASNGDLRS